jgi:sec-independent protein translocase protein TatB
MFGVDSTELIIVALAALIFIGPKELPAAMRTLGRWVGRARAHARHFTAGIENMMREAELEEMEARWREENERIMREHPVAVPYAGASENVGGPSTAFATSGNEAGTGGDAVSPSPSPPPSPQPPVPNNAETLKPSHDEDEPGLPLPDPDHHQRELP